MNYLWTSTSAVRAVADRDARLDRGRMIDESALVVRAPAHDKAAPERSVLELMRLSRARPSEARVA